MVVDAFTFGFEEEVLRLRLQLLYDHVDAFVLVESEKTQSLLDKPLVFNSNKRKYSKFLDKIIHVVVKAEECKNFDPSSWQMENFQRNAIARGLAGFSDSATVMVSDVDEIPSPEIVRHIRGFPSGLPRSIRISQRVFYANLEQADASWIGAVAASKKDVIYASPQGLRNVKDMMPAYEGVNGWHLSYMGGKQAVYRKFQSCIEPIDKSALSTFEKFSEDFDRKIKDGGSFLFSDKQDDSRKLIRNDDLPFDPSEYPSLIWTP